MISKDIGHIRWRFNNCLVGEDGKTRKEPLPMYVSSNDLKALNGIIKYVNKEKERELNNYQLFTKLFINVFKNDLIKSKGNYQLALGSVKMILSIDTEEHLRAFKDEINQIWLEEVIESKGIDDNFDYPKWNTEQTKDSLNNVISNLIEDYG